MDDNARLRLECLKIAEACRNAGDKRDVLVIAEIFLRWVLDGTAQHSKSSSPPPNIGQQSAFPFISQRLPNAPKSIKEMVLVLLRENMPRGLTALEILEKINLRWWPHLPRTSLSPQLSRLKQRKEIQHENGMYRIPMNDDAPPVKTDEALR